MENGGIGSGDFPTREKSVNVVVKSVSVGEKIRECFVIVTMEMRGITFSVHGGFWFMKKAANGNTIKFGELVQWGQGG